MRKIIICSAPMQERLFPLIYSSDELSLPTSGHPVTYPILSFLETNLKAEDSVKVILLYKRDPQGRCLNNVKQFQREFQDRCRLEAEYKLLDIEFDESRVATEKLLAEIVRECEESAEIISDITYGTKAMPVVLLAALSFAVKHLKCRVRHVFYGQVYFQDGKPAVPKLRDLSYLLYLNSLIYALEYDSPSKARRSLDTLLNL